MDNNDIKLINLSSYVKPDVKEHNGRKWVLNGEKNSFPQYVIDRRIGSPTNGSILEVFCELLYGKGLAVKDSYEVYDELVEIFPKREQRKCLNDFETFGYYFMQILRGKGPEKKIAKILHLPAEKIGRDKMDANGDINGAWYCDDWTNTNKYKPKFIPEFKGKLTESLMVKSVVPHQQGQNYFALPNYIQGLQYAEMEEEISNYCINHIKNGLSFGYIINFNNGSALTPEQKNDIERMIKQKLTGSTNAGKFILSFNDNKEAEVSVVPLDVNDAHNQWDFLTKEARQQIITAHGAYPNLFGINNGNGFSNNADELDVQSKLVQDYQITPKQSYFIDELAELLEVNGLETDLYFIPLRDSYKSTEQSEAQGTVTDETVDENELENDDVRLSEHFNVENLIELGEDVSDDWEIIEERRCDEITLNETQLNTVFEFANVPKTTNKKSNQDTSLFKIRYRYAGNKKGEREFCNKVLKANKVYRAEDLDANYNYNEKFAPKGKSSYNLFLYKGGVNCKHFWERVIFLRKGNDRISVNKARKMILSLEPSERKDARWETNDKKVAQVAEPKNNWWSLKPNYRK